MKRLAIVLLIGACGSDPPPPLDYHNPSGGKLRLVHDGKSQPTKLVLDLVVGDAPLTGFSAGFDLPLDDTKITFISFTPGTTLAQGSGVPAAFGAIPTSGPLAHELVTAQTQKATDTPTDASLQPGDVLYSFELDLVMGAEPGVIFDGTDPAFALPSGGLRDRAGNTVVAPADVAIGKLEVH